MSGICSSVASVIWSFILDFCIWCLLLPSALLLLTECKDWQWFFFFFVEQTFFTCFRKVSGSCFPALPYWWSLNTRFIGCLQTKQAEHFILVLIFLFFKFVALYIFSCHFVCFLILSNISWIKVEPCLDVMSKKVAERKNVLSLVLWCYQDITFFDMQHFIRQY